MPEAAERYRGWEPPAPYMSHDEYADWWRPCIGDCWADASSGLPFLDMKKITRESLKKAEKPSIRWQNTKPRAIQNPYTKIWTNQVRTVLFWCLLQPVQDRIPEKCWEEGLQNPEWSWYVQFQRAAQIELWTGQKAPLDVMRKELKEIIREENEKAQTEWFCNSVTSWEINVIVNL